jgi:hypothetical protein
MDFTIAIVIYLLLLLMLLVITLSMRIRMFSAITVSMLLSGIFLMFLVPPSDINRYTNDMIDGYDCGSRRNGIAVTLFCVIYILTLLVITWYILCKVNDDVIPETQTHSETQI